MKFAIKKNILIKNLENVVKSIDSANIYAQLRNFSIIVLDQMIIIRGSNGSFSIESKIESKDVESIERIGNFLIPSNIFLNLIKKCDGVIELSIENDNTLYVKNNQDQYQINLLESNNYPPIDFSLYGEKINLNSRRLKEAIDNVIFASSQLTEEIILSGVNLKYENNILSITATDSFRLAQETIEIKDDRNVTFDVTLLNKNIKNFIPSNLDKEVTLYVNEHKINLISENTNYQSKIIDAPYKDISAIMKIEYSKQLTISKSVLNNAINKATIVSLGDSSYNKLHLVIDNEKIDLDTHSNEIGKVNVVINKEQYEYKGESIKITLNYKYLREAINIFNDKINIYFIDEKNPIMITDDKRSNVQIISPMIS